MSGCRSLSRVEPLFVTSSGYTRYSDVASQARAVLNYDHPDEREGVDLRSYSNVDFRSSLAKKQAAAAAMIKDMGSELGADEHMDTSSDMLDTPTNAETMKPSAHGPEAETDTPAPAPDEDLESLVGTMPVSYGVRIGEDGELDGGEDFGDHVDYDSTDLGEDYVEDDEDAEEDSAGDWAEEALTPEDSEADGSLH